MSPRTVTVSPLTLLAGAVALAVVLTPAAYAAGLAKNSVGTAQLKNGAVTAPKLKDGAVTRAKIAVNAVTSDQVKAGSLGSSDLAPGAVPAKTVVVDHVFGPGEPVQTANIGGIHYEVKCDTSSIDLAALNLSLLSPAGTDEVEVAGTIVNGSTAQVSVLRGPEINLPNEPGSGGSKTTGVDLRVTRSGVSTALVQMSLRVDDGSTTPCRLRLAITPIG